MANLRLRLTRQWPFPGKDILASLIFSKNRASRRRFPVFQGILALPWGLLLCDTRSSIEWQLFVTMEYEPVIAALIRGLLKPGDCFVDVGANIGAHSLMAASQVGAAGQVIAIEPNPTIFERLRQNCLLNHAQNIALHQCALGDRVGAGSLAVFPDRFNQGQSTLVPQGHQAHTVDVSITTGDELLANLRLPPITLIKIDAEGWEAPIVWGFRRTLEVQSPIFIFEHQAVLWKAAGYGLQDVAEFLAGYELYEIAFAGLTPIRRAKVYDRSADILAIPASRRGALP